MPEGAPRCKSTGALSFLVVDSSLMVDALPEFFGARAFAGPRSAMGSGSVPRDRPIGIPLVRIAGSVARVRGLRPRRSVCGVPITCIAMPLYGA